MSSYSRYPSFNIYLAYWHKGLSTFLQHHPCLSCHSFIAQPLNSCWINFHTSDTWTIFAPSGHTFEKQLTRYCSFILLLFLSTDQFLWKRLLFPHMSVMIRFSLAEWKIKTPIYFPFLRPARFGFHDGNILLGIFIVMGCSFVVNITYYRPNVELACEWKFPTLRLDLCPDEVRNFFFYLHAKFVGCWM